MLVNLSSNPDMMDDIVESQVKRIIIKIYARLVLSNLACF